VAPLFVQSNRRIQALVTVICLALLIFCLVERQVRRAIAPDRTLQGCTSASGQAHRPADLPGPGRSAADPGQRPRPADHPPTPPLQARLLELPDVTPPSLPDQPENPMDPNGRNPQWLLMCEGPG